MTDSLQVAAFEGGALRLLSEDKESSEAVLALPLNRLILRMIRVPEEGRADPAAYAAPLLEARSPYPDEPLTVSYEVVRESERGLIILAAALPESAAEDIGEALDAHHLNVTRVDALVLGELRRFWSEIKTADGERRLIKIKSVDCTTFLVMDGDTPVSIRAVSEGAAEKREEMLSLLEAEDFGGPKALKETLTFESDVNKAMAGVAERTMEAGSFNALPASWAEVLAETRFKAKLVRRLTVAGVIWALIIAVLFGVPVVFGFMTDHQKTLCKEHARQYNEVAKIKGKVEIFKKYSNHNRGALEIMKLISDRLPAGIDLDNWTFSRENGLKISGLADTDKSIFDFKNSLAAVVAADEEEPLFPRIEMGNVTSSRGRYKFSIDLGFVEEEAE